MEFTDRLYQTGKEHVSHDHVRMPTAVLGALYSLSASQDPDVSMLTFDDNEQSRTWKALWLCGSHLIFVEATAENPHWSSDGTGTDTLETSSASGWVRSLGDLRSIEIVDQRTALGNFKENWTYCQWVVKFGDIEVPLFQPSGEEGESKLDVFALALRKKWMGVVTE